MSSSESELLGRLALPSPGNLRASSLRVFLGCGEEEEEDSRSTLSALGSTCSGRSKVSVSTGKPTKPKQTNEAEKSILSFSLSLYVCTNICLLSISLSLTCIAWPGDPPQGAIAMVRYKHTPVQVHCHAPGLRKRRHTARAILAAPLSTARQGRHHSWQSHSRGQHSPINAITTLLHTAPTSPLTYIQLFFSVGSFFTDRTTTYMHICAPDLGA